MGAAGLGVEKVGPGATVQDLGRPGRMHEGVPPGGALVPALLRAANTAIGNPPGAAAIELPLHGARFRARGAIRVALDDVVHSLADGDVLDAGAGAAAVRYVALPGGADVPVVLGGRGTLLVAGLGGFAGRALRVGDLVRAAGGDEDGAGAAGTFCAPAPDAPVRVVLGPDAFDAAAVAALTGEVFRLAPAFDRVGARLAGAVIPGARPDRRGAGPMVRGALQVARDGTVIALGPDHPTTGGYPVIAVVVVADHGALALRRPGAAVRFTPVGARVPARGDVLTTPPGRPAG